MKSEYDFSRASVGKFYREGASVRLPDGGSDQRPDDRRTPQFDKLLALLKELFQLDRPDLDFGFYRIMHAKSAEITKFLEQDLLPQVRDALSQHQSADRAVLERELADALRSAEALGVNPDASTTVKDLRARLDHAVDVNTLEAEVYDHLYGFFRRYYSDGDFISKRVYKPGVYAIPYEGEEVKLHWANADQYYIKTAEYLRDYAFRLRPGESDPMRVRFQLASATEGEHGNLKTSAASKRVFVLRDTDFIAEQDSEKGKELVLNFEYRPATLTDWPNEQRNDKKRPPAQSDLLAQAEDRLRQTKSRPFARWLQALGQPHIAADGNQADYSRFRLHLNRFTARHTFDYFIHKDLGGFLRRELDFYINNEVMRLGDVEHAAALQVEQHLSRIKVVRRIGTKIIDFLAQLEDFQKALWLKKKFVVETSYCIRLGCIPKAFHAEIVANDGQRTEWRDLLGCSASEETPQHGPIPTFLERHGPSHANGIEEYPSLLLDTRHYDSAFTDRLLEVLSDSGALDDQCDGVLIHGENLQALRLLHARYRRKIKTVYIDPPYNTDASAILYKNDYKDSSWLSLMADRLSQARELLTSDGSACVAIDDEEVSLLRLLLQDYFDKELGIATVRSNPAGRKSQGQFSPVHEYALFFGNSDAVPGSLQKTGSELARYPHNDQDGRYAWNNLVRHGSGDRREDRPKLFFPIYVSDNDSIRVPVMEWDSAKQEYVIHDEPRSDEIPVWPIQLQDSVRVEKRWHRGPGRIAAALGDYRVRRSTKGSDNGRDGIDIDFKIRMDAKAMPRSWWDDTRYASANLGAKMLKALFREKRFDFTKAVGLVEDCLRAASCDAQSTALDFFAGAGTTGHAVISMNRDDDGRRKFVLVEMGNHFESVLLERIKKITYSPEWEDGRPKREPSLEEVERSPQVIKVLRLESYEDTLNNLAEPQRDDAQPMFRSLEDPRLADFRREHLLSYVLDVDVRGSQSLLNVTAFADPIAYRLKVRQPGTDESRGIDVDLVETFNWLIGIAVRRIGTPRTYQAETKRDEEGRLRLKGGLKEHADGPWWFRTVIGTVPDGRRVLVIWRKRPGGESPDGIERDNLVLAEWFRMEYSLRDDDAYDIVYVNGSNNLENLKSPSDTWTVRLIEDDFHRLMWEQ